MAFCFIYRQLLCTLHGKPLYTNYKNEKKFCYGLGHGSGPWWLFIWF